MSDDPALIAPDRMLPINQDNLAGTIALVTGAGRGIGLATAHELARQGSALVLLDRTFSQQAESLIEKIRSMGRIAVAATVDLADHQGCATFLEQLLVALPPIDILVNNAGWLQVRAFGEVTLAEWQRHLDTNLTSMFVVTQAVLPGMLAHGRGRIINISSELALTGVAGYVAYSTSKAGVVGFTRALAREVAPAGIRVNTVAPGPTVTAMLTDMSEEYTDDNRQTIPAQRFGQPDDIARTVAFLAGAGGDFFVGQVLSPNGGVVI